MKIPERNHSDFHPIINEFMFCAMLFIPCLDASKGYCVVLCMFLLSHEQISLGKIWSRRFAAVVTG
jgi:hypothetical protein